MQEAGYNTYYVGKLWNFHTVDNYNAPFAKGFNSSDFLLDPFTYQYWNAKMSHDGGEPVSYAGQYSTDVVSEKASRLLDRALSEEEPFFLTVSPIAPHSNWIIEPEKDLSYLMEPRSAPRHQHLFKDYKIPRDDSFNKRITGSASWVKDLQALNDTVIEYNDHYQRQRLRALQSVDEMVNDLVQKLDKSGELDNTYIFYSTDNGYHISQHRMHPGKECGYDTDIHIPFYVRGPGVEEGGTVDVVTTHTDVSSTMLSIAGVSKRLDGIAMPLDNSHKPEDRYEHASIEYWGLGAAEGLYGVRTDRHREAGQFQGAYDNNTYKGLRLVAKDYSLYYSVWCTNETELFDLKSDPFQTINLLNSPKSAKDFTIAGRSMETILPRLNALVMVLKTCKDESCTQPWSRLHPHGKVSSLTHALDERFDAFYEAQPQMWFLECPKGYIAEVENQSPIIVQSEQSNFVVQGDSGRNLNWEKHWKHFT